MNPIAILVVDDDVEFQTLISSALQDEGFRTITASSGHQAIDRIQIEKPHFMILDLLLPEMPGDEVCRIVKENPLLRNIIVIITTAKDDLNRKLACFENGANEYLVKPVDPREIVARIKRFIRMIDEFKTSAPVVGAPAGDHRIMAPSAQLDKEPSHGTVDIGPKSSDSFARIKPKYGIYRVENLIGSGGMGYVFKAYDEPLERFVAVKILSKRLSNSPEFVERFRREAKVLASINHPGIAFIYSFGEEEGEHYFAMQWCQGGSLQDLIRKKGRLELLPTIDIILQCAHALSAASRKGVVHRDVKPSNLLFDENQQIKIVDFGLASAEKNRSARITQVQEFLGTPSFMAPEQAQSSAVDHRADIYALGITFYYMLYGAHPFEANSAIEMVIKHASEPFPAFNNQGGRIPRAAYDIIEKMTRKNPAERYADYQSLIQDLEKLRIQLLSQSQWKIPRADKQSSVPFLRDTNFFELLSVLFNQGTSGVVNIRWSQLQKKFLIRQREIVLFESSQHDENIWNTLLQTEVLKKEQLPLPSEDLEKSLNRFLLNQTFTLEEFKASYRRLMKAALMQVFFWPVFEGDFFPATIEHDAFTTIRIADILLEAARSLINYDHVKNHLQKEHLIQRTPQFDVILASLDISPEESFLISRLEGDSSSLNTLQLLTGQTEEKIGRFLFVLEKLGAIQLKSADERRIPRRTDVPATPPPSKSYPVKETTSVRVTEKAKISDSDKQLKPKEDTLHRLAAKRFVESSKSMTDSDSVVRMEFQKSEKRIEQEHNVKVAEQFFRLAQDKFAELDYWKVTQLCKQAIKNNPSDSKYYHLMAQAYAQHPRFGKDAEQSFYKAIEVDPWNPDYHVDLAKFYLQQGLHARAINQCEKALKLAPHHEQALQLFQELNARK